MAKTYRISIVVEEVDSPRDIPHLLQRDTIGHYRASPQALRIAREIARKERREEDAEN